MQFRTFIIPVGDDGSLAEALNRFLRGHRVVSVQRQVVEVPGGPAWAFCVEYLQPEAAMAAGGGQRQRIDYREVLPPEQFAVFARLREERKRLADQHQVPPYAVFSNEQLAAMVTEQVRDLAGLQRLPGIGAGKAQRFGAAMLAVLGAGATDA
ncbi:MAG: HRDC domain-containing protein [Planctomycetota bacterium]